MSIPQTCQDQALEGLLDLLTRICQTPAPTFAETARGALVAELLKGAGLLPYTDAVGNVIADLPGGRGPRVLVAAHLDTVFPAETDVTVRKHGTRLRAPGIGDNSASLAVLLRYVQRVMDPSQRASAAGATRPRLTVAATVGEEGLGDLYGIRQLMKERSRDFDLVIALDGHLGTIVNQAVGSKRYQFRFSAKGGHSWGDYPSPSAIHALGDAIHALNQLTVPSQPRSSYNVGRVAGGTSINAIAEEASFDLDLRSVGAEVLKRLERQALEAVRHVASRQGVDYDAKLVGDRPTARVPNQPLVRAATRALRELSVPVRLAASSTDANAAMTVGLPAVAFGVYKGGDAHRLSEWLEPASLLTGYRALELLMEQVSKLVSPAESLD